MADRFRWRPGGNGPRRPRNRLTGCLLWIVGIIILLLVLSLLFGGFQKGTKAAGPPGPVPALAWAQAGP
jgi:hypothetical protein